MKKCEKGFNPNRFGGRGVLPEERLEFAKSEEFVRVRGLISDALSPASRGRRIVIPSGVPPTQSKDDP